MQIIVDNLKTEYRVEGSGDKCLLFLHGWGTSMKSFDRVVSIVKEKFKIILVDLPGFGATERPINWKLSDYVYFVNDFLTKIDTVPDVFVGHSFGGRIILKGVGGGVFNPKKIVLISPAGVSISKQGKDNLVFVSKLFRFLTYLPPFIFFRERIKTKFYEIIGSDYLSQGSMKEIFKAVVDEDLSPYASEIETPTLIIWGDKDEITKIEDGKKLYSLIPDSVFQVLPNTGHFSFEEYPDRVADLIQDFLNK
jgi:pimeloyl-ACP methyl ester carboxylesterase